MNLHAYFGNNPMNAVDACGLFPSINVILFFTGTGLFSRVTAVAYVNGMVAISELQVRPGIRLLAGIAVACIFTIVWVAPMFISSQMQDDTDVMPGLTLPLYAASMVPTLMYLAVTRGKDLNRVRETIGS